MKVGLGLVFHPIVEYCLLHKEAFMDEAQSAITHVCAVASLVSKYSLPILDVFLFTFVRNVSDSLSYGIEFDQIQQFSSRR